MLDTSLDDPEFSYSNSNSSSNSDSEVDFSPEVKIREISSSSESYNVDENKKLVELTNYSLFDNVNTTINLIKKK